MKKVAHIVFSFWLALLLLFGDTPKEFIHTFTSHIDTVDSRHQHDGLVADNQHHHCSFISFHLLPFEQGFQPAFVLFTTTSFSTYYAVHPVSFIPRSISTTTLRGPPVA